MGAKTHQFTTTEIAMRAVLLLQKSRTRDTETAVRLVRDRFGVSKATAYRIVANAGAALGFNYQRQQYEGYVPHSTGYPGSAKGACR